MVILGYKTGYGSIIRALCAIGIGGVMIFMPNKGIELIIKIIGAVIFAAGLVSLTISVINRKHLKSNQFVFNMILGGIVAGLGLLMIFFPEILTKTIIVVVGLGLIIFGCMQMLVVGSAASLLKLSYAPLCFGAMAIIGGIFLLFQPFAEYTMSIIAGSLLVYYGISELVSVKRVSAVRKEYEARYGKAPEKKSAPETKEIVKEDGLKDVKDAEFKEVDDQ
jgi:uncharacterized membrane protein HdeD (DUF308 family)